MKESDKLLDFGVHIPGSRKELHEWRNRFKELKNEEDVSYLPSIAMSKLKSSLILDYNAEKDFQSGTNPDLVYIRKMIFDSLPKSIRSKPTKSDVLRYTSYGFDLAPFLHQDLSYDYLQEFKNTFLILDKKGTLLKDIYSYNLGHINKLYKFLIKLDAYKTPEEKHTFLQKERLLTQQFLAEDDIQAGIAQNCYKIRKIESDEDLYQINGKLYTSTRLLNYIYPSIRLNEHIHDAHSIRGKYIIINMVPEKNIRKPGLPLEQQYPFIVPSDKNLVFSTKKEAEKHIQELACQCISLYKDHLAKEKKEKEEIRRKAAKKKIVQAEPSSLALLDISTDDFQKRFGIPGVQFGNYVNQTQRVLHYNYASNAFVTLSDILNISRMSIGFHDQMTVSFGARGQGRAAAHFEPLTGVINITRDKGSGCIAHEWLHAFDHFYAKHLNLRFENCTEANEASMPKTVSRLLNAIRFNSDGSKTEFFQSSLTSAYKSSSAELFAYAGEAVIQYKMQQSGANTPYLVKLNFDGSRYPTLDHVKMLEPYYDALFKEAVITGLFKTPDVEPDIEFKKPKEKELSVKPSAKRSKTRKPPPQNEHAQQLTLFSYNRF